MKSAATAAPGCDPGELRAVIERFLKTCIRPAILEPGEEVLPLAPDAYSVELTSSRLTIQAWDDRRNVVRRITGVHQQRRGCMELNIERFAKKEGRLLLVDLARPDNQTSERRGVRLVFRERFRIFLRREFPDWKLIELSTEANLEYTLSPAYPRAFLRKGQHGWAAIAAPPEATDPGQALSFGLIWLDYLRRREPGVAVEGLVLLVPLGTERMVCSRLPFLNSSVARYEVLVYSKDGYTVSIDPRDYGNLDTKLDPCLTAPPQTQAWVDRLQDLPDIEQVRNSDGSISLRVHGIQFARLSGQDMQFGLNSRTPARDFNLDEVKSLASELAGMRSPSNGNHQNALYRQNPEAWLESQVRSDIERVDASLWPSPIYGQVPAMLGGERGIIDLLAVDRSGRLCVLELKASEDIHLPLQALDYWMRVQWHLDRDEFSAHGYFPGISLRKEAPRLLLVAPALNFHPTTEIILSYLSPSIEVERIGVNSAWREKVQVMFRLKGADKP